ncbi:MAG: septum formation initiator family protein [Bacillota bacterium]|nr:septum formation initiator family protein [Bacillota bacterium]
MAGRRSLEKRRRDKEAGMTYADVESARQDRRARREEALRKKEENEKARSGSKKRRERSARRRLVLGLVFLAVAGLLVVSVYNLVKLTVEENRVEAELAVLQAEKEALEEELEQADRPEYIEQQAREQLDMIYPGEVLYIIKEKERQAEEAEEEGAEEAP